MELAFACCETCSGSLHLPVSVIGGKCGLCTVDFTSLRMSVACISVHMFVQVQTCTCTTTLSGNAPHAHTEVKSTVRGNVHESEDHKARRDFSLRDLDYIRLASAT